MHSFICNSERSSSQNECDLLVAIAALVTEGRIPGPPETGKAKTKDFHEGPHCSLITGVNRAHKCDSNIPLCEKFRRNRETVLKLFKKGVPFCIEVLFTCACKELGKIETGNLDNAVLLEQWCFYVSSNRGTLATPLNVNQLISAIRSQLYFSQITAWLVTQDKASPIRSENLRYRLSSPEELLAPLTFALTASKHEFPVSDLGNGTTLSISFLSAPRLSTKPTFDCTVCFSKKLVKLDLGISSTNMEPKTDLFDDRMHTSCTVKGKHCCEDIEDSVSVKEKTADCNNTLCQRDNTGIHDRWFSRNIKKPKSNHSIEPTACRVRSLYESSNANNFAKEIEEAKWDFERHTWPHDRCHNFNDLKTVQDKGQLLLDAIERSGQNVSFNNYHCVQKQNWSKQSECDNFCDMSERDKLFSHKERNNFNIYVDNNCDSPISIRPTRNVRDVSNINLSKLVPKSTGARKKITFSDDEPIPEKPSTESYSLNTTNARDILIIPEPTKFRRNLGNTTSTIFHARTGLPLSSSPAPVRKGKNRFDFDSSLNSVSAIKSALFSTSFSTDEESESEGSVVSPCSPEIYTGPKRDLGPVIYRRKGRPTSLLGTFEESVLNGRLEPVSTVHGFTAELGASGSFVPKHIFVPVTTFFYAFGDHDRVSTPYMGHISLEKKGYNVPKFGTVQVTLFNRLGTMGYISLEKKGYNVRKVGTVQVILFKPLGTMGHISLEKKGYNVPKVGTVQVILFKPLGTMGHISLEKKGYNVPKVGTVQVTLFNPLGTVVKMFVLPYDLSEMPVNSQTFIRQRTLYLPTGYSNEKLELVPKWLRYLIHVRFMSSKSGKIYLHRDIRMLIMRKSDMDTATAHDMDMNYELRSFTLMPTNPRFSPRK